MKLAARLESISPYAPIEPYEVLSERLGFTPDQIVKLDANENPYGLSPRTRQTLANLTYAHIYPDPESRALRSALADFTGAPDANLLPGSGADELIDLILRALIEPEDYVLSCPPTFGMYAFDTAINAGQLIEISRRADFSLDVPAVRQAVELYKPKVLFLTSPNNPDGSLPKDGEIDELLELPVLLVLDEAYVEFTRSGGRLGEAQSRIRQVSQRENLIVLRTFSKWAGLAGLRVGYGAFPSWLMPALWKIKQPYNVNVAATQAALASLADLDWLAGNVELLRQERDHLYSRLSSMSDRIVPYPSETNFILCRLLSKPAAVLKDRLAARGILVRYYTSSRLADCIRISIGRPQDTDRLVAALEMEL